MSLHANVLRHDALRAGEAGLELDLRLNWYRSLPLSCVRTIELSLDGEPISPEEITVVANGHESSLAELADRSEELWFVLDPVTVRVPGRRLRRGDEVEVRVRLGNRIPYILVAPERPLEYVSDRSATLVAR